MEGKIEGMGKMRKQTQLWDDLKETGYWKWEE